MVALLSIPKGLLTTKFIRMKLPKNFYKMSLKDQEEVLVKKIEELYAQEDQVRKMLATIRGGYKIIEPREIDRPDEFTLKS
jgi:hypothetical protein